MRTRANKGAAGPSEEAVLSPPKSKVTKKKASNTPVISVRPKRSSVTTLPPPPPPSPSPPPSTSGALARQDSPASPGPGQRRPGGGVPLPGSGSDSEESDSSRCGPSYLLNKFENH